MNNSKKWLGTFILSTVLSTVLTGCAFNRDRSTPSSAHLLAWMQGSFNSAAQAGNDSRYYNIHLNMVEIWPQHKNGPWLYVEQAAEGFLDKPYRQRVYQIQDLGNGRFESKVYSFDNPLDYAGEWRKAEPLAQLTPEDLHLRVGCSVFLTWQPQNNAYQGSTDAQNCKSQLRGAAYATAIVSVHRDKIESWDQGFDNHNAQVWGAVKAGYIFNRL